MTFRANASARIAAALGFIGKRSHPQNWENLDMHNTQLNESLICRSAGLHRKVEER
jgi:hypothetical protein